MLPLFLYLRAIYFIDKKCIYKNSVFLIKRSGFFFYHLLKNINFPFENDIKKRYLTIFSAEKVFIIEEEPEKTQLQFIKKNVNDAMNI